VGRLFWKFFAFIWLAQLAGIVAIASAFWLNEPRFDRSSGEINSGPGAGDRIEAAAAIFRYAGVAGFKEWAGSEPGPAVFAVDDSGRDILGRTVEPGLLDRARQLQINPRGATMVRELVGSNGSRYLLFSVARSPFGPPGAPPPERGPRPRVGTRGMPPLNPMLATLLASLGTALVLAWYVAKPIRTLRAAFDNVAAGNLGVRVAPSIGGRHDELADLGRDFDRMADRLQASMNGQRRLLHDVSHEMRSPLARLQAAAGLIRLKYGQQEPVIERIEEEIVRIDRLIGDLLTLSRLEAGELAEPEEEVDMQELVCEVVTDANFEAQPTGRTVTWDGQITAMVSGRPEMLHGAIENVVRNALKHAPQSREVRVETTIESAIDGKHSQYALRVLDTGAGVPEHELAGLFTPFFRAADAARTSGYGLGLAIARRSIEAHGGSITAVNRPAGGFAVTILLPLSAPAPHAPANPGTGPSFQ
jgi:two-component system OmpR family sensor kinase